MCQVAKDFALCEEYTFKTQTLSFAFLCLSEEVGLRSMLGLLPPTFGTATSCVGVLAVETRIRVTRGFAGSIGISSFFLAF